MSTRDKTKDWTYTPARGIILHDLENGNLPLFEEKISTEEAFHQHYKDNGVVQAVGLKEFKKKVENSS